MAQVDQLLPVSGGEGYVLSPLPPGFAEIQVSLDYIYPHSLVDLITDME